MMCCRNSRVDKVTDDGRQGKGSVVDVYVVVGEIGGVEPIAAGVRADGQSRVDVARHADDDLSAGAAGSVPRNNVAGDRVEDEEGSGGRAAARRRDLEVGGRVAHSARGQAARKGDGLRARVEDD